MENLRLTRLPFALALDRTVAPLFPLGLSAVMLWTGWVLWKFGHAPIAMAAACALASLGLVALARTLRRHAWPVAIELDDDAIVLETTSGRTRVSRREARGVSLAGNGVTGLLGRAIALRYERNGRTEWLGLGNGYLGPDGTRLRGATLIRRLNDALGKKG